MPSTPVPVLPECYQYVQCRTYNLFAHTLPNIATPLLSKNWSWQNQSYFLRIGRQSTRQHHRLWNLGIARVMAYRWFWITPFLHRICAVIAIHNNSAGTVDVTAEIFCQRMYADYFKAWSAYWVLFNHRESFLSSLGIIKNTFAYMILYFVFELLDVSFYF